MAASVKTIRKMLGRISDDLSDEQLSKEIEVAEFLKTLYFDMNSSNNRHSNGEA